MATGECRDQSRMGADPSHPTFCGEESWRAGDILLRALTKSRNGYAPTSGVGPDAGGGIHSAHCLCESRRADSCAYGAPQRRDSHTTGAGRLELADSETALDRKPTAG